MEQSGRKRPCGKLADLIERIGEKAAWDFYCSMPMAAYHVLEPWTCLVNPPTAMASTPKWRHYRDKMLKLADQPNFLTVADAADEFLWWRSTTSLDYRFWDE